MSRWMFIATLALGCASSVEGSSTLGTDSAFVRAVVEANGAEIGLGASDRIEARDRIVDPSGVEHVRYARFHGGLPVLGGDFVAHVNSHGGLEGFSATLREAPEVDARPVIDAARARDVARSAAVGRITRVGEASLLVHALGAPRLAWEVVIEGVRDDQTPSSLHVYVDARDGQVLSTRDGVQTVAATGTGRSFYLGNVSINTNSIAGGFELRDPTRGSMYVVDMKGKTTGAGSIFTDNDNVWGNNTTRDRATVAVDAHYAARAVWDYYRNVHGRTGVGGDGATIVSRVHYGSNYNGAFWTDSTLSMTYGDGDGSNFSALTEIDICGHEITHGVINRTAGLVYSGESGGLNEATADIMGTGVEWYANLSTDPGDYLIGEKVTLTGLHYQRNLAHPTLDGVSIDHYSRYVAGMDVHRSSGIANNFFYLLSEGGRNDTSNITVTGITRAKAERIWYRALTVYMTSGTTFSQARAATLSAASDLYGATSTERSAVAATWTACGVN